jgi:hypothetical protein
MVRAIQESHEAARTKRLQAPKTLSAHRRDPEKEGKAVKEIDWEPRIAIKDMVQDVIKHRAEIRELWVKTFLAENVKVGDSLWRILDDYCLCEQMDHATGILKFWMERRKGKL